MLASRFGRFWPRDRSGDGGAPARTEHADRDEARQRRDAAAASERDVRDRGRGGLDDGPRRRQGSACHSGGVYRTK